MSDLGSFSFSNAGGPDVRAWLVGCAVTGAIALILLVYVQGFMWRKRRERAWPDRLEDLLLDFAPWVPLRVFAGVLGALVFVLGIVWIGDWVLIVASFATGVALLVLVNRRWHAVLVYQATLLMALTLVSLVIASGRMIVPERANPATLDWAFALIGLSVMVFLWDGLALFWRQQLRDGVAWTTAGRLIEPARKTGIVLAVAALLVAGRLAVETLGMLSDTTGIGDTGGWVAGVGTGLLLLVLLNRALSWRRKFFGTLSCVAAVEAGALLFARF